MSCKCNKKRRSCPIALNTYVAGTNACSSFRNVLTKCGFRAHNCGH